MRDSLKDRIISDDPSKLQGIYGSSILTLEKQPTSRQFDGVDFPYILKLDFNEDLENSLSFFKDISSQGIFDDLIFKHGAVLIKNIGHSSAAHFSKLITAIEEGRGNKPYQQIGLAGKRHEKAKNVFTANEGPPSIRFYQHNEYARYTHFPPYIHFFCSEAATQGGETPLGHSAELFEKVYEAMPEFIEELVQRRVKSSQNYPSKLSKRNFEGNEFHWEDADAFGHFIKDGDSRKVQKEKAEVMIRKLTDDFTWNEDESVTIHQHVPPIRVHPVSGKPIFFNGLVGRFGTARDKEALDPPYIGNDGGYYAPIAFSDGELIPKNKLLKILEISLLLEFNHKWEDGDLVLVDNYQVSHGRLPWYDGNRVILVSMWDNGENRPKEWNPKLSA